ncbi:MAG TPA: hypothetical protein PLI53_02225 [Geobacteraceae bacterium]|nr:hypothetical protein [Geobacteraceae bacterium]
MHKKLYSLYIGMPSFLNYDRQKARHIQKLINYVIISRKIFFSSKKSAPNHTSCRSSAKKFWFRLLFALKGMLSNEVTALIKIRSTRDAMQEELVAQSLLTGFDAIRKKPLSQAGNEYFLLPAAKKTHEYNRLRLQGYIRHSISRQTFSATASAPHFS